jgi:hypothetical protein
MTQLQQELAAVLARAADALRAGAGALEFSRLFYTDDLLVVGEGWPRSIRGLERFLPDLSALIEGWGPNADLTFDIVATFPGGTQAATTLADVYVAPRRPEAVAEYYRVMYAWRLTPAGWRIAAEMYTVGSF